MERRIINFLRPFREFIKNKVTGGFLLLFCVAFSLIINNSVFASDYHHFFSNTFGIRFDQYEFTKDFHFWINDGLMAIFFLLVGLEIKREFLEGELSDIKKSSLPIIAAIGGMVIPAIIYAAFNFQSETIHGWGIPMATDIAFAIAILSLLGKKIPLGLKIFLTALAIVDDLGAIVVIAVFYTQSLALNYIFYAGIVLIILYALNISKVNNLFYYIPFGILLWFFIYKSGIHATVAGVLFAFMIPTNKTKHISTLEYLEQLLHKPVSFIVMPLFALSNTDILFNMEAIKSLLHPIGLGIFSGLVFGKVIGIALFSYLSIKLKWAELPTNTTWKHLIGAGFLGGIGFTMSIFISLLSFDDVSLQNISKLSILFASIVAGLVGYLILSTGKELDETDELKEVETHSLA